MRRFFTAVLIFLVGITCFAQTVVKEKELGKKLEKNKDSSAVFVSEIDLSKMSVSDTGTITIPLFVKNKISIVSGMDMTNIKERIAYTKKSVFLVTFQTESLKPKIYAIMSIQIYKIPVPTIQLLLFS